jgi:hypothetical protein
MHVSCPKLLNGFWNFTLGGLVNLDGRINFGQQACQSNIFPIQNFLKMAQYNEKKVHNSKYRPYLLWSTTSVWNICRYGENLGQFAGYSWHVINMPTDWKRRRLLQRLVELQHVSGCHTCVCYVHKQITPFWAQNTPLREQWSQER